MKKIKNILQSIRNIYSYPSILLHELSHIIIFYIVGAKVNNVEFIKSENCGIGFLVYPDRILSKTKTILTCYSPFLVIAILGVLACFNIFFLGLFIYTLTNMGKGLALPSETDFEVVRNYDKTMDEFLNDPDMCFAEN